MNAESHSQDPVLTTVLHDPEADKSHVAEEQPHDQATEVAHAWHHFWQNARFFAVFLTVILLTVLSFNINFGSWNTAVALVMAALRSGLIAFFLATLFKDFSFVFRTLTFTALFLACMIWLSLWDSTIKAGWVGDPIRLPGQYDTAPKPASEKTPSHVP
jgi:hypothetical protein